MEVLQIFHFVFGTWRVKELYDLAGEAHVLVAIMDVCFKILFMNFVIHKLMVLFQLIFRNHFLNDAQNCTRVQ